MTSLAGTVSLFGAVDIFALFGLVCLVVLPVVLLVVYLIGKGKTDSLGTARCHRCGHEGPLKPSWRFGRGYVPACAKCESESWFKLEPLCQPPLLTQNSSPSRARAVSLSDALLEAGRPRVTKAPLLQTMAAGRRETGAALATLIHGAAGCSGYSVADIAKEIQAGTSVPFFLQDGKICITDEQLQQIEPHMDTIREYCESLVRDAATVRSPSSRRTAEEPQRGVAET